MDECSGKRAGGGLVIPRKGCGLVLRDNSDNRDQNAQFCNRVGCKGRLNHTKGSQVGCSQQQPKSSRSTFRSSNGKEVKSSTKTCSADNYRSKSFQSQKKIVPQLEIESSEASSVQDDTEGSELTMSPRVTQKCFHSDLKEAKSGEVGLTKVKSSSVTPIIRPRKILRQNSGLSNQLGSSSPQTSKSSTLEGAKNSVNSSRYGLKNLRCNTISDVLPSGCSSSESHLNQKKEVMKKRNSEGEGSSSARGKRTIRASAEEGRSAISGSGVSTDSKQARNSPPVRDNNNISVRTRRSVNGNSRTKISNQGNGNNRAVTRTRVIRPQMPEPEMRSGVNVPKSSRQFSAEASSSRSNSRSSRPNSSGGSITSMMPIDLGDHTLIRNAEALRRYNLDSIAEVLLALERIEQDEVLTYEQLLALETNVFPSGLSFYDQHRDMRLDIDNMSYEELLALEEEMGNVVTAVPEDTLTKCIRRSIFQLMPPTEGTTGCSSGDGDDTKCSICQEEYAVGEEVGRLGCEHGYHVECIKQWLRLKNWCPICKCAASATPTL